jgi:hypothetical protein
MRDPRPDKQSALQALVPAYRQTRRLSRSLIVLRRSDGVEALRYCPLFPDLKNSESLKTERV